MSYQTSHILIVDDDRQIRASLSRYLRENGFRTTQAEDGNAMLSALDKSKFDVILLDVMMPGESGMDLCKKIRQNNNIPIILLTAVSAEADKIKGLEIGADDYVVKPFSPKELLARVKSTIRRSQISSLKKLNTNLNITYEFNDWIINILERSLTSPEGILVMLTSGEFDLLHVFVEHPNEVLCRDQLLDFVRGRSLSVFDRAIDVQISRLRRKIEFDIQQPTIIKTVRNEGYILSSKVTKEIN